MIAAVNNFLTELASLLRCYLEGDAGDRYWPRRMLITYETARLDEDVLIRCRLPSGLRVGSSSPEPMSLGEELSWQPRSRIRVLDSGRRFRCFSVTAEVEGEAPGFRVSCRSEVDAFGELKRGRLFIVRYSLSVQGLREARLIVGPFDPRVEVRARPRGQMSRWRADDLGDILLLIYDNPPPEVELDICLPPRGNMLLPARLEGRAALPPGMSVEALSGSRVIARAEELFIIAYLDELHLG